MNNEMHPTNNDNEWTEFETRLRGQSLGPGPTHLGNMMYQCGYAAGVAEARKNIRAATIRWQFVSLAASTLACLSLSVHFFRTQGDPEQFGEANSGNITRQQSTDVQSDWSENTWVMHLTRERQLDQQESGILRASSRMKDPADTGVLVDESRSISFPPSCQPLRPSDFPRFL